MRLKSRHEFDFSFFCFVQKGFGFERQRGNLSDNKDSYLSNQVSFLLCGTLGTPASLFLLTMAEAEGKPLSKFFAESFEEKLLGQTGGGGASNETFLTPGTRLLEKRREMADVQTDLESQKQVLLRQKLLVARSSDPCRISVAQKVP